MPPSAPNPDDLYTVSAAGFNATADAFARDPDTDTDTLWFLSMLGSQTALKAIWASLLKQPPDAAHLIQGAEGMALSGNYQRCVIPQQTIGTWATKIARLPVSGGWHALVYTKLAEYASERGDFLLLAQSKAEAPGLHHRFLDRRSPLPLHRSWADGSGARAFRTAPSSRSSRWASWPTAAPPTPTGAGRPVRGGGGGAADFAGGREGRLKWIGR